LKKPTGSITDQLDLPRQNDPKINTLQLVTNWLCDETNRRWTIVLDNADNIEEFYPKQKRRRDDSEDMSAALAAFLPQSHNGSIFITTRSKDAASQLVRGYKNIIDVNAIDKSQAMKLLRKKLCHTSEDSSIAALAHALDCMPLAISRAAAYIN
jgi:hypothetical protein